MITILLMLQMNKYKYTHTQVIKKKNKHKHDLTFGGGNTSLRRGLPDLRRRLGNMAAVLSADNPTGSLAKDSKLFVLTEQQKCSG